MNVIVGAKGGVRPDIPKCCVPGGATAARPLGHSIEVSWAGVNSLLSGHTWLREPARWARHRATRGARVVAGAERPGRLGLSQSGYGTGEEEDEGEAASGQMGHPARGRGKREDRSAFHPAENVSPPVESAPRWERRYYDAGACLAGRGIADSKKAGAWPSL